MTLSDYLGDWLKVIDTKILSRILTILEKEYSNKMITPTQNNVFKAFNLCPYDSLKVIFLGLDPYPQKDVATGILFGNAKNIPNNALSPSLQIVKESVIDYTIPKNSIIFDNSLENWCKQGVLMINSALTTEVNKTGSHTMLWRPFISSLLENISYKNSGIVYVLLGSQAQTFTPYINAKFNDILLDKHPAYYARIGEKMSNKIFREIDKLLIHKYGKSIKWFTEY